MTHTIDIQFRFNDFDIFGHVNNNAYLEYLDIAKVSFLAEICKDEDFLSHTPLVLAHIECDFVQPTHRDEQISVQTNLARVGQSSVTLQQQIVNSLGEVKLTASSVLVAIDPQTSKSVPLPQNFIK